MDNTAMLSKRRAKLERDRKWPRRSEFVANRQVICLYRLATQYSYDQVSSTALRHEPRKLSL